ncbi:FGGY-family carbohydrate kinase [Yoonia sp.]|uniref:FGGY-family carbohydrate kinase n=1 Tax=Yoonia sp. TaxID=2212373 RepID=UPI002DFD3BEB|nr:FGGY-family carbohydrate kinase [Yoonia sp.]
MSHIAVIDIGKTNAKLALVNAATLAEIAVVTRPNTVLPGPPWPHFDVEGHWEFLLEGLARFHADHGIAEITVTTHGACAALIEHDGKLAAPILDYEHKGPDTLADDYDAIRPAFTETGSPRLGLGLNIGAQLFWQFRTDPTLKDRTRHIVTYPQYWGFRLTGVAATDVTSLGCHTDLWNPHKGTPSSLVEQLRIEDLLAPVHRPADVLGPILPEIAARTGLARDTPVRTGIHDSNASLLPHLQYREAPFNVVSTGTWVIVMAIGGKPVTLDPTLDTLVNVNAFGDPVPSARFMGGREHDLALERRAAAVNDSDLEEVLDNQIMLMPALVPETGPFAGSQAHWIGVEPAIGSGKRTAAVGFYLALVTARCLELVGHEGPVIVEGPFAQNGPFLWMLATASASPVIPMGSATGTSPGAALLVVKSGQQPLLRPSPLVPDDRFSAALEHYAKIWRSAAAQISNQ